jgi:hypothetical protein
MAAVVSQSFSEPNYGADNVITVAFGGRTNEMESTVGHFANAMPIRIPWTESFQSGSDLSVANFDTLVKMISQQVSRAKKFERFSALDLARAWNRRGNSVPPTQVAITLSPKLTHQESCLFPHLSYPGSHGN